MKVDMIVIMYGKRKHTIYFIYGEIQDYQENLLTRYTSKTKWKTYKGKVDTTM